MYDINQVKTAANGRWLDICNSAGMGIEGISTKHEPCPICPDHWPRFRFDNKQGDGTFICNHCGAGDGLELLKLYMGNFKDAIEHAAGYLGIDEEKEIDWQKIEARKRESERLNKIRMNEEAEKKRLASDNAKQGANLIISYAEFCQSHNYLIKKQISGKTAFVMSQDFLVPAKNNKQININGSLIIPMINERRELVNCQVIKPDGFKMFLLDGQVIGAFHLIGKPKPGATMLIGEGYATMDTLSDATGLASVVAFNANNLQAVAQIIDYLYPDSTKLICADNDWHNNGKKVGNAGITKAIAASQAIGCDFIAPPTCRGVSDFNDFDVIHNRADLLNYLKLQKVFDNIQAI